NKPILVEHAYVLQLLALVVPLSSTIKAVLGTFLWAGNLEQKTLVIVTIDFFVVFAAGVVSISLFGILGAAITSMLAGVVVCGLHIYFTWNLLPKIHWLKVIWQPILASSVMGLVLILIPITQIQILFLIFVGIATYGITLLGLQFLWPDSPLLNAVRPKLMN
ncbi:MAG: polysaccharide biosynthesis C-terminal domain-containing protein, partial [Desulfobulbia bacterium]